MEFSIGVGFELGLGVVAIVVGWFVGSSALARLGVESMSDIFRDLLVGVTFAVPIGVFVVLFDRIPIRIFTGLRHLTFQQLEPMFRGCSLLQIIALSISAGIGEELLFRGLIQAGVQNSMHGTAGQIAGVVVANVLFAAVHLLNWTYGIWALTMGIYISLVFLATDSLFVVIVLHAAYDAFALSYILRRAEQQRHE